MKTRSHTRFVAPSASLSSASARYQPYPKPVSTASRASPSITSPESSFRHLSPTSSIATSIDDLWDSSPTKEGPSSYHQSEASTSATSISSGSRSGAQTTKNDMQEKHRAYAQRLMTNASAFPLESPEEKRPAPLQKRLLMQMVFDEITPYPDQIWMCLISNVLRLHYSRVKNWFSNQRLPAQRRRRNTPTDCRVVAFKNNGRNLRLRPAVLEVMPRHEWTDDLFNEILMIHNFRLIAAAARGEELRPTM